MSNPNDYFAGASFDPTNGNAVFPRSTKKAWTQREDHLLLQLTEIHGKTNWNIIAEGLNGRSGAICHIFR
jgi:hypothetical protein